jgi:peptidoglycan L-alanyl-D-glutamate endopeptidase CwlK
MFSPDARSSENLSGLHPRVQNLALILLQRALEAEIIIKIISGMRTIEEQDKIYAKGRTAPGKIVTTKRGGFSNHNFGLAFDIGIFKGKKYIEESPDYRSIGKLGESIGLVWGGSWKSFPDEPHFELRPEWAIEITSSDEYLSKLRGLAAQNKDFFS